MNTSILKLVFLILLVTWPMPSNGEINTFPMVGDTSAVSLAACGSGLNEADTASVGHACGKGCLTYRAFIHTNLSTIPASATITSARLSLYSEQQTGANFAVNINRSTRTGWTESSATWAKYDCPT